ncbi:hypothetical protein BKA70DRAFT_752152 [Coprinopsis sp. MPI-PUGE-AT-0042]|nr:hypothetical protein BKA70DRAFT_752152 [Coprinopsis sp. MPI-PUGE-AT-0042]
MTPPIDRIPDEILLKILNIHADRPDLHPIEDTSPATSFNVIQEIGFNQPAIRLVCRRWSKIARELLYKSISIRNTQDTDYITALLRLEENTSNQDSSSTLPLHVRRIAIVFDDPFLAEMETLPNDILDTLVNIILSCANLNALSIRGPIYWPDMDISLIMSVLLSASPSVERLELRLSGSINWGQRLPPLNQHLRVSLKTLWVSSQVLHELFHTPTALPQLHALVVERDSDEGVAERLSHLKNLRLPVLQSSTIISNAGTPIPLHQARIVGSQQVLNMFGCHVAEEGSNLTPFEHLYAVGLFFRELESKSLMHSSALARVKSVTILFKEEGFSRLRSAGQWLGDQRGNKSLEDNLYSIACKRLFPRLKEMKFWLPLSSSKNDCLVLWEYNQRYVWKERLEKIGNDRPGLSFYVGSSDECWRAKVWQKTTAQEASEMLLK